MPCSNNGQIPRADLVSINGGQLIEEAAAGWKAPHGPEASGCYPEGPQGSYRDLAGQNATWAAYQAGGNLAAVPGTSEHGCGKAVDLAAEWMRSWIDDHGAKFGWRKTEAFSEWWHVNFVGGVAFRLFDVLKHGMKGKRVAWYTKRLAFIHPKGKSHGYLHRNFWKYKDAVVAAVKDFQGDHGLKADGVLGEQTAHKISEVFHKQYIARNKRRRLVRGDNGKLTVKRGGRKRSKRDAVLLRP
jgi:hypothetical protein